MRAEESKALRVLGTQREREKVVSQQTLTSNGSTLHEGAASRATRPLPLRETRPEGPNLHKSGHGRAHSRGARLARHPRGTSGSLLRLRSDVSPQGGERSASAGILRARIAFNQSLFPPKDSLQVFITTLEGFFPQEKKNCLGTLICIYQKSYIFFAS